MLLATASRILTSKATLHKSKPLKLRPTQHPKTRKPPPLSGTLRFCSAPWCGGRRRGRPELHWPGLQSLRGVCGGQRPWIFVRLLRCRACRCPFRRSRGRYCSSACMRKLESECHPFSLRMLSRAAQSALGGHPWHRHRPWLCARQDSRADYGRSGVCNHRPVLRGASLKQCSL